jgi:hypothetical protein
MFMYGLKLGANLERNFNEAFRNGAITYGSFSGKSVEEQKNKAVSLGFKSIELNGYTFHNKHLTLFSHPKLLGQKGFEYTKWGLLIPNLTGVMYDGSSNSTPYNAFCIRHYDLTKQGMYKGAAGDVTPVKASWVVQPGSGGTNKTKSQRNYVAHVGSEAKGIVKTFVVQPN